MSKKGKTLKVLLVIGLSILLASSTFAVIKGLEYVKPIKQSMVKVGADVVVPENANVLSAVAVGGSVTVAGKVDEDAVAVGGNLYLKETAMVGGNAVSVGGKVEKNPKAIVQGDIVEVSIPGVASSLLTKGTIIKVLTIFSIISFISFLVLTMILVALFTPQLGQISLAVEKHIAKTLLVGLLMVILFVPIIVLLAISVIGIVLIPLWVMLVVLAGIFGFTAGAHLIGKKVLVAFRIRGRSMMVETIVGVVFLFIAGLIPFLGHLVISIVTLWGLGGVTLTRFGTVRAA